MIETSKIAEMKRYLFYEMPEKEREEVQEHFFEDTEYFNELMELENDLIDSYARGELTGEDLTRFEKSLEKSPERREEILNARTLQTLIAKENPEPVPAAAAPPGVWEQIMSFFDFRNSLFQYAAGTLAVLVVCVGGFLLYQNWQKQNEYAEIEKRQEAERIEKENRLRQMEEDAKRLEEERRRNDANNQQLNNLNTNSQDSLNQSDEEQKKKTEIEKLRKEVEDLQRRRGIPPRDPNEIKPSTPYLAVSIFPIGRGGDTGGEPSAELTVVNGKQVVKVTKPLPEDKKFSSYQISSKGTEIESKNIAAGAKSIIFYLPPEIGEFEIRATEAATRGNSQILGNYEIKPTKK